MEDQKKEKRNRNAIIFLFFSIFVVLILSSDMDGVDKILTPFSWFLLIGFPAYLGYLIVRYFENKF